MASRKALANPPEPHNHKQEGTIDRREVATLLPTSVRGQTRVVSLTLAMSRKAGLCFRRMELADIIYLACPYTHPDPRVRSRRYDIATAAAATLIRKGLIIFSPITMTHPIDAILAGTDDTLGSDYWVKFDETFMSVCSEMIILTLEGWDSSAGIRRERQFFEYAAKRVSFMQESDVEFAPASG